MCNVYKQFSLFSSTLEKNVGKWGNAQPEPATNAAIPHTTTPSYCFAASTFLKSAPLAPPPILSTYEDESSSSGNCFS